VCDGQGCPGSRCARCGRTCWGTSWTLGTWRLWTPTWWSRRTRRGPCWTTSPSRSCSCMRRQAVQQDHLERTFLDHTFWCGESDGVRNPPPPPHHHHHLTCWWREVRSCRIKHATSMVLFSTSYLAVSSNTAEEKADLLGHVMTLQGLILDLSPYLQELVSFKAWVQQIIMAFGRSGECWRGMPAEISSTAGYGRTASVCITTFHSSRSPRTPAPILGPRERVDCLPANEVTFNGYASTNP